MAQIHRFRDAVALHIGEGETVYLRPREARRIARYLNAAAKDVQARPFGESEFKTQSFDLEDVTTCGPRLQRDHTGKA